MGIMFGFAGHRRQQLVAELKRMAAELPQLGVERAWLIGDLATDSMTPSSELELVLIHDTNEPFHRRADFFSTHLRPAVGTRFVVYTPDEAEELQDSDRVLIDAMRGEYV
jgi:hypothetical protein